MRISALPLYDGVSQKRYGFSRSLRLVAAEVATVRQNRSARPLHDPSRRQRPQQGSVFLRQHTERLASAHPTLPEPLGKLTKDSLTTINAAAGLAGNGPRTIGTTSQPRPVNLCSGTGRIERKTATCSHSA